MWPNPQFSADLVTFTEEILNENVHFLWSDYDHDCSLDFSKSITLLELSEKTKNCFSVLDHFVGLSLKRLGKIVGSMEFLSTSW